MRRVLDARLSARALPSGLHGERIQWLYDGLATATPCPSSNASPSSPSGSAAPDSVQTTKKYLLYWMQTSVRAHYNYALEYAVAAANALALPLHVVYMLSDRSVVPPSYAPRDPNAFGVATERHAKFALEGLACVANKLQARGLSFQVIHHHHERTARSDPIDFWAEEDHDTEDDEEEKEDSGRHPTRSDLLDHCARDAALVITDRPYLRPFKDALMQCVEDAQAKSRVWGIVQVEGDVVVPCEQVTNKEEYAARTIRPKVTAQLKKYLVPLDHVDVAPVSRTAKRPLKLDETLTTLDIIQIDKVLQLLDVDRSVQGVSCFIGGEDEATRTTQVFLKNKLARYATDRNEPSGDGGSNLSLYLRHGHVSPVSIALAAQERQSSATKDGLASFLEEMIVRRELAVNLCVYNDSYDTMNCLPEYATITLHEHADDRREHLYNVHQLERGETFDAYWNAAQREMAVTGRMHGYMRMYWCKKILEWTIKPELGFRIALYLNNKYALDAPDPNSYTGVAWSFGKHDQGWKERPIFGKVRYMNEAGLKRKFRMDAYVSKIQRFEALAARGALENATVDGVVRPTNANVTKTTKRNAKDRATNDQDDGKASTKRSKRSNKRV